MTDTPTRARLTAKTDARGRRRDGVSVDVHFNPESLALTIRNSMEEAKRDTTAGRPSQLIASSEVTLALQLIFDTTTSGVDVRTSTAEIAEMMRPGAVVPREDGKKRPLVVEFSWNEFAFEGIISDYSETLDYFSAEGIPLRSNLNLTLTKHEAAFPQAGSAAGGSDVGAGSAPPTAPVASGDTVDDSVNRSGSAGAPGSVPGGSNGAQDVAAANGIENLKDPGVAELAAPEAAFSAGAAAGAFGSPLSGGGAFAGAGAGIEFGAPPVAFASGDAGYGLDLGASASAGLSLGGGLSAGASLGGGGELGLGDVAAVAGAAGSLELDAFAGLNPPSFKASASLGGAIDFELPDAPGLGGGMSIGAGVSLGGMAGLSAGAGIGAGVGGGQVASVGKEINLADILFKEDV